MIVLSLLYTDKKNAGPKAPSDISRILADHYHARISQLSRRGNFRLKAAIKLFTTGLFHRHELIVVQHPYLYKGWTYHFIPRRNAVLLVHDISGFRNQDPVLEKKEQSVFSHFNTIIVHNQAMKELLLERGIPEKKLYVLEIFDYLAASLPDNSGPSDTPVRIVYAGNLRKSPFIYQLDSSRMNYHLALYGLGLDHDLTDHISYEGSFDPDDLSMLKGNAGLIWDGAADDSDQNEPLKNYTRYNSPHKLSCYIAAGLPVIVWRQAAVAPFVAQNDIGYLIDTLDDINTLDFSLLPQKRKNVLHLGEKVRSGGFTTTVFDQIMADLHLH